MFLKAFTERCTTSDLHLFKATYAKCSYDVTYTYSALGTAKTVATFTQTIPLLSQADFAIGPWDKRPLFRKHQKVLGQNPNLKHQSIIDTVNFLSNNNFKCLNYIKFSSFCNVERSQDLFRCIYLMAIPQGDPDLKT